MIFPYEASANRRNSLGSGEALNKNKRDREKEIDFIKMEASVLCLLFNLVWINM